MKNNYFCFCKTEHALPKNQPHPPTHTRTLMTRSPKETKPNQSANPITTKRQSKSSTRAPTTFTTFADSRPLSLSLSLSPLYATMTFYFNFYFSFFFFSMKREEEVVIVSKQTGGTLTELRRRQLTTA